MRLFNKFFSVIAVFGFFISVEGIVFADSNGIMFNWQPFIVNDYQGLNHPLKNILPKNYLFASEEMWGQYGDGEELLHIDLKMINNSNKEATKNSTLSRIKITFSQVNSFMLPGDEIYSRGKDGKLSAATRILPSLLRNPSQEMTLETLKLIEPQVNFGFEF